MNIINDIYAKARRTVSEQIGSRAATLGGQTRAMRGRRTLLARAQREVEAAPVAQPWLLDRLPKGAIVTLSSKLNYGYAFEPLRDTELEARASEVIGRCGQRSNYTTGSAQVFGEAFQKGWTTINYRGAYKGYKGRMLHQNYQSCVGISRSGRSAIVIQSCVVRRRIIAPAGMQFERDAQGVLLRRVRDGMDYHPSSGDWKARDFAARVRRAMTANFRKRREAARAAREAARVQAILQRELPSVRVTLEDSRAAGNCVEGSLRWCEARLHLARETILGGSYLFSVAASQLLRTGDCAAERAVLRAWQRETMVAI